MTDRRSRREMIAQLVVLVLPAPEAMEVLKSPLRCRSVYRGWAGMYRRLLRRLRTHSTLNRFVTRPRTGLRPAGSMFGVVLYGAWLSFILVVNFRRSLSLTFASITTLFLSGLAFLLFINKLVVAYLTMILYVYDYNGGSKI